MADFQVFKEVALPGTLVPNAVYFLAPTGSQFLEVAVVDSSGSAYRKTLTSTDVQALISSNMAAMNDLSVVPNIAARDALAPTTIRLALVQDATADATVATGAAMYVWAGSSWQKVSEYESLDIDLTWASIAGRPTSTPAELDAAVQATNLKSPAFTYSGGNLVGVTYADGSVKTLTYSGSQLTRVDLVRGTITYRKDFTYSGGNLVAVVDTQL